MQKSVKKYLLGKSACFKMKVDGRVGVDQHSTRIRMAVVAMGICV